VITVRPLRDDEVDVYVAVRTRVHPATPMPRDVVVADRAKPDHLDLIAEVDGDPVGVASTSKFGGAPDGDLAYVTIRVLREHRRRGVGTALHRRASEHARLLGKSRFYTAVRHDDVDSLGYYTGSGYEEVGRMQDVVLDLTTAAGELHVPEGLEILPLTEEHDPASYAVALEADADIPAGTQLRSGTFDQWRRQTLGPMAIRELSFVAVEDGRVVGYAVMGAFTQDTAQHWMTGVARAARGHGVASALKEAQIAAAKQSGWKFLRTQNDLGNAPMRRVNEKLGYVRKFEWVHLAGPLLSG
jgi:GNAT superfamily N-acetyltransferase